MKEVFFIETAAEVETVFLMKVQNYVYNRIQTVLKNEYHFYISNRHMSLQNNELENNRDTTNRLGSTTSTPNNGSSNSSQSTTLASKPNNDEKFTENRKVSQNPTPQVANVSDVTVNSSAIEGEKGIDMATAAVNNKNNNINDGIKNSKSTKSDPTVIRLTGNIVAEATTSQGDCINTGKATTTVCDNEVRVKCENDDDTTSETSSGSGSGENVFKTTKHISKPNLGNLHANQGGTSTRCTTNNSSIIVTTQCAHVR